MVRDIVSVIKRNYINELVSKDRRVDERKLNDIRPITIELNPISTAEGSARVRLGNTDVLVGIKAGIGEPYPDSPDRGVLTTNAELVPLASPYFEIGPPKEEAIELSRVVDRGIREGKTISLDKLCIIPGEKVWILYIDIHVLDYDGNLFDAGTLGALAALTNTFLPLSRYEESDDRKLEVEHYPLACTMVKLGDKLVVDPSADEEKVCSARLTITTDENGDIRAMQKGNGGHFSIEELKNAVKVAQDVNLRIRNQFGFFGNLAK